MYTKYPRTPHLPWSEGRSKDDERWFDSSAFDDKLVVITEKMDGENTTLYTDRVHSRSLDTDYHWSRTWVKNFRAKIGYNIPSWMRICGENLQARHSIQYNELPSLFLGFSVWEDNLCLNWHETLEWLDLLGIEPVPQLACGKWESDQVQNVIRGWKDSDNSEGYVVRLFDSFSYTEFDNSVAKYVRKNHIQTRRHWLKNSIEKNTMARV
jgi:hypothetical protein